MPSNSIFPNDTAGGLEIRDAAGAPTMPPGVENAYVPDPAFTSTCPLTALPSDCTARIEPRQINAIVSEMLALAECWDPNGPWECASLVNLCSAFQVWAATITSLITVADDPPTGVQPNHLWWESDTGAMFIWFDDGDSQQWVQVSGGGSIVMDNVSIVGAGMIGNPHMVGLVDCGTY
jgi:hypothetical protein